MKNIFFKTGLFGLLFILAYGGMSCKKSRPCVDINAIQPGSPCPNHYAPVCGCDDFTYQNACFAERNGVQAWYDGPCF